MSRVGRQPVPVPKGVTVTVEGNTVRVQGPKGKLEETLPRAVRARVVSDRVEVTREDDERESRALHGLSRTLVANMVEGVVSGFQKSLDLVGTGYRASKNGNKLVLTVGYSHPVEITPPAGIEVDVPAANSVVVRGIDKQLVGQVAANVRAVREPSAYGEGKGIRYTGERVRTKQGKTGK